MIGRVGEGGRKQNKTNKKPNAVFSRENKNKTIKNKRIGERFPAHTRRTKNENQKWRTKNKRTANNNKQKNLPPRPSGIWSLRHVLVWSLRCEPRCHLTNTTTITEKRNHTHSHTHYYYYYQTKSRQLSPIQTKLHFFVVVIVQPPFHNKHTHSK